MAKHAFRRVAATTGLVAGVLAVTAGGAAGSQGGYYPAIGGYDYIADSGESNQITARQTGGRFDLTDAGVALIRPADPTTDPLSCRLLLNRVSCPEAQEMNLTLGDGDDAVDVQGVNLVRVSGGAGRDVVRADRNVQFSPGPGPDDLIPGSPGWGSLWDYEGQAGNMRITLDGVANDGPPGENDNVRPGVRLRAGAGDDHITGSAGPDFIDCGDGNDTAVVDPLDTTTDCETIEVGS